MFGVIIIWSDLFLENIMELYWLINVDGLVALKDSVIFCAQDNVVETAFCSFIKF